MAIYSIQLFIHHAFYLNEYLKRKIEFMLINFDFDFGLVDQSQTNGNQHKAWTSMDLNAASSS